jgi:hypothetical protein
MARQNKIIKMYVCARQKTYLETRDEGSEPMVIGVAERGTQARYIKNVDGEIVIG